MSVFSTVATGGRKRRGEGHTRREEILHAAKELFLEQGYDQTTIRRIADRVGISAPALYLYFKDKEALMLALCDQTFGHLIEAISEIEKTVDDPLERVRRFGEAYARFGLTHPDEYRLIFMGSNIPGIDAQDRPSRTDRRSDATGHRRRDRLQPPRGDAVPGRGVGHQAQLPAGHLRRTLLDGHPRPGRGLHHEARLPVVQSRAADFGQCWTFT